MAGSTRVDDARIDDEDEKTLLARHLGMNEKDDEHLMWIAELVLKEVIKESTAHLRMNFVKAWLRTKRQTIRPYTFVT